MISDDELYKIIGTNVRKARENAGLSQNELAVAVGLSRTSITNIEAGQQKIQIHTLFKIGEILDITPQSLMPSMTLNDQVVSNRASGITDKERAEKEWIERIIKR
ncbi:MAG: helix-turn-helix domain-containing protein [Anaerolineae bacterium]|nr:helix-turn-helix domain-containing protein [Anaerolineae bacterium]